jgi:hypothetical protein
MAEAGANRTNDPIIPAQTNRQSDSHDDRHGHARWRRMAQPRRLEAPLSNRRHRSNVDVLAHAAKETYVLHGAQIILGRYSQRKAFAATAVQIRNTSARAATSPLCAIHPSRRQIPLSSDTA